MSSALVRELIDAGIHFGHRASRWNPKMAPYIFGKRNSIHIIDIRETVKGLLRAKKFVTAVVSSGQDVL
ncbi:MAG: 30S ribosomal protein S2, partial [Phycisphaerales bacterium]|nr:30S ribosomal protein S2 [Phycisphaerales bacterium]